MTAIQITPSWSEVKPSGCYVYIHRRATDGSAFYVGKGSRMRGWQRTASCGRSDWWIRTAKKNSVVIEIVMDGMTDHDALELEVLLIKKMRSEGERLVNISDGGDGASGVSKSGIVYCSTGEVFNSCAEASSEMIRIGYLTANTSRIFSCANGDRPASYDRAWSFNGVPNKPKSLKEHRRGWYGKPVVCENGMRFASLSDAADWLQTQSYPKANPCNIGACCRGVRPNAYGFTWRYE